LDEGRETHLLGHRGVPGGGVLFLLSASLGLLMRQIFPTDYRDPVEHEQWLETQKKPEPEIEQDYDFIDRLFARVKEMQDD
jgi:hypothetical protein